MVNILIEAFLVSVFTSIFIRITERFIEKSKCVSSVQIGSNMALKRLTKRKGVPPENSDEKKE